jgi:hypothetical protein
MSGSGTGGGFSCSGVLDSGTGGSGMITDKRVFGVSGTGSSDQGKLGLSQDASVTILGGSCSTGKGPVDSGGVGTNSWYIAWGF